MSSHNRSAIFWTRADPLALGRLSEFELGILRSRMLDAARSKARRGELRIPVPVRRQSGWMSDRGWRNFALLQDTVFAGLIRAGLRP